MQKKWQIKEKISNNFKELFPQIDEISLQLLYNRNLKTQAEIDEFLNSDYQKDIHNPFLFKDMTKAVERIFLAIKKDESIVVHGDYDADGVTGSAILIKTLLFLGAKKVDVFIPHREKEGYGLNSNTIEQLYKNQTNLVITTDCGISSYKEVEQANKLDIDVIITDHHTIPENIPKSIAIINPRISVDTYPYKNLAGVGIAFKLAQALLQNSDKEKKAKEIFEKWLLDLVAIGTIADCSEILGENRTLVKYGLIVLGKTKNIGLQSLFKNIGYDFGKTKFNSYNVGFQIAPRINAAGRLGHANTAYNLLVSSDQEEVEKLALDLDLTNKERQKQTEYIFQEAKKQAEEQIADFIIIVNNKEWPIGILGLVAGKLVNEFGKPVLAIGEKKGEMAGSARSIEQFNVIQGISQCSDSLLHFGGHSQAAGFTIKKGEFDNFVKKIKELAKESLKNEDLSPALRIDAELKLTHIDWDLFENLEKFEPYGEGNSEPIFLLKKVEIEDVSGIGQEGKHLKLKIRQEKKIMNAIGFHLGNNEDEEKCWCKKIHKGSLVDLVVNITLNEWNGNRELQLKIVDMREDFSTQL
jgi:single-stranded-DNA-specific exonuclease